MDDEKKELTIASGLDELKSQIETETDVEKLKNVVNMFNLNIKKKEILRKELISQLQDKAVSQIGERITKHPDEFSNKDLLDYTKTFRELLSQDDKILDTDAPIIQYNNPTQININVSEGSETLNREERERVADAVKAILKRTQSPVEDVIDVAINNIEGDEDNHE